MTVKKDGDFALTRDSLYGTLNEPTYAGATSFMRRRYSRDLDGVDLVVTGVPLDTATTSVPGCDPKTGSCTALANDVPATATRSFLDSAIRIRLRPRADPLVQESEL